jgi:Flp pilus assembly protein TadG
MKSIVLATFYGIAGMVDFTGMVLAFNSVRHALDAVSTTVF